MSRTGRKSMHHVSSISLPHASCEGWTWVQTEAEHQIAAQQPLRSMDRPQATPLLDQTNKTRTRKVLAITGTVACQPKTYLSTSSSHHVLKSESCRERTMLRVFTRSLAFLGNMRYESLSKTKYSFLLGGTYRTAVVERFTCSDVLRTSVARS